MWLRTRLKVASFAPTWRTANSCSERSGLARACARSNSGSGGDRYQEDHDDTGPLHVAFTVRLIAESDDLAIAIPAIRVYQTRTGKLVVYRDWRGGTLEDAGATYREFPDLKTLVASPSALDTLWIDGSGNGERSDLDRQFLHHAAAALREKLVIRID